MGRRKNPAVERTLVPDSDEEDDGERVQLMPEQHSYRDADGRAHRDYSLFEAPASPSKAKPVRSLKADVPEPETPSDGYADGLGAPPQMNNEEPVYDLLSEGHSAVKKKGKKYNPLQRWVEKQRPQQYLDELILLEGRGDYQDDDCCIICGAGEGVYRCRECFTDDLYCQRCIVLAHGSLPLHRVEKWTDGMFERTTLKTLGLRIQLGHGLPGSKLPARKCGSPKKAREDDFVIIDTNGIHEVGLDFCNCAKAQPHDIQLLRARLYPASGTDPRTAATFRVLRRYHLMTLQSKCSGLDFYNTCARETNNSGTEAVRDRYDEFLRMGRQWRHLQMLKRAGRGHCPHGVQMTKPGECALLCPACPQPGKNLPEDWKDVPKERRFLYALFLALDANFRMRRKNVSSEVQDPSLGDGWSFYTEIAPYYEYLATNWRNKQPRSTCVAHDAVDKPDRESRGTASSGIATVDCARHNMKRPNSVGDLQLGERYINMDYLFFIGLAGSEISQLFVSYDIACQWHRNLQLRMETFPQEVRFVKGKKYIVFLIPKFHLPAHIEACNILFSFHLTRFVGMTDGEAPERGWSALNPLAASTAEMGPGNRRDTINDAFNDMNHKKIIGLGQWVVDKLRDCVPELISAASELEELEASLRNLGAGEVLEEWRAEVEAWEGDSEKTNPFASKVEKKTVVDVRRAMAAEVQEEMTEDELEGLAASEEMHATELIGMGLQLEELQRSLGFDMARIGNHPTSEQQANMTERANKLRRKILTWMDAQLLVTPYVAQLRAAEDRARAKISATQTQPGIQVQHMALWLPSAINGRMECDVALYEYEFRLREGQAHEALDALRHQLLFRTHLFKYKDRFVRGVRGNSRSQTKIEGVEERIRREAERYRAARRALVNLGNHLGEEGWQKELLPLSSEDVRGMPRALFQDPERKKLLMKKGPNARKQAAARGQEAKARMSWIWRSPGVEDSGEGGMNEALRIEWLKTRARFLRQLEQLDLLEEEKRRILQFLDWRAGWWDAQANKRPRAPEDEGERDPDVQYAPEDKAYAEGNIAYAKRQAALLHGERRDRCFGRSGREAG
ncbi:hypothetical protein B0H19DRAFT_188597 [Mycena capillaripes]|nr:hypothetical protein B0H19DRAFT_188597 [Mycena capillaripes]